MGCAPREGGVLMVHAARSYRALLLAIAMALPLSASAQDGYVEEAEAVRGVERWHPNAYADPASGFLIADCVSSEPLAPGDYTVIHGEGEGEIALPTSGAMIPWADAGFPSCDLLMNRATTSSPRSRSGGRWMFTTLSR